MSKSQFMALFHLHDDPTRPVTPELPDSHMECFDPGEYGIRIDCGQEMSFTVGEHCRSLYIISGEGLLSNEVFLSDDVEAYAFTVSIRGGWKTPCYPVLGLLQDNVSRRDRISMLQRKRQKVAMYLREQQANRTLSAFDSLLSDYLDKTLQREFVRIGIRRLQIYLDWLADLKSIDIQGKYLKYFFEVRIEPNQFSISHDPDEPEEYIEYPLSSKEQLYLEVEKTIRLIQE